MGAFPNSRDESSSQGRLFLDRADPQTETLRMAHFLAAIVLSLMAAAPVLSQAQLPSFAAASIKPNNSERNGGIQFLPGGRLMVTNLNPRILIARAYGIPFQSPRLSGGPDWIRSQRYDIEAVAEEGAVRPDDSPQRRELQIRLMLQSLLIDRFRLRIHREMREVLVYALVVKDGAKLRSAKIQQNDCVGASVAQDQTAPCHSLVGGQGRGLTGRSVDMSDIANFLENWSDRPLVDLTGRSGLYDVDTEGWSPLRSGPPSLPGAAPSSEELAAADPSTPSLFSVLESVGLKLESTKAKVEVIVIDSIERPSEN